jgi:hypothetical protein
MRALLDDNRSIYVTDDTPAAEKIYNARFYFDPNSISMASGNSHYIFYGLSGSSTVVLRLEFRNSSGNYQVRASTRNDSSTFSNTAWITISDTVHALEVDWTASTSTVAINGQTTLYIDGIARGMINSIDNDTRQIDRVQIGAVNGVDSGTRGSYFFDSFRAHRITTIGP